MARRRKADQAQSEMPLEPDFAALAKLSDAELIDGSYRLAELLTEHRGYREALKTESRRLKASMERTALEINMAVRKLLDARQARQQKGLEFEAAVPTHDATSALAEVAKLAVEGEAGATAEGDVPAAAEPVTLDGPEPEVSPSVFELCTKCAGPVVEITQPGDTERRFRCSFQPPSDFACDWIGVVRAEGAVAAEEIQRPDAKRHAVTVHGVEVQPILVIGDDDSERPMWRAIHPRMPDISARGETPDEAYNALGVAGTAEEPEGITGERVTKFTGRRGRAKTRGEVAEEASATA